MTLCNTREMYSLLYFYVYWTEDQHKGYSYACMTTVLMVPVLRTLHMHYCMSAFHKHMHIYAHSHIQDIHRKHIIHMYI